MTTFLIILGVILGVAIGVTIYDVTQRKHTILHNFSVIGHFRYILESIGPELRGTCTKSGFRGRHSDPNGPIR